jgi:hypothetical protein
MSRNKSFFSYFFFPGDQPIESHAPIGGSSVGEAGMAGALRFPLTVRQPPRNNETIVWDPADSTQECP